MSAINRHQCIASTLSPDGDPDHFEVTCSIHGTVVTYSVNDVLMLGVKEVQRKIDRAWCLHACAKNN